MPTTFRNVALLAHDGTGKTALTEALVRFGAPDRASKDGSTERLDSDPEERKRNFTLSMRLTYFDVGDTRVNVVDCPGFSNFLHEAERALRVCEGGLLLISAVDGARYKAEMHWALGEDAKAPLIGVVNQLDLERASFQGAMDSMEEALKCRPLPLQLPIGEGPSFKGVVDLISMKAHLYGTNGKFGDFKETDCPADLKAEAEKLRNQLIETAAEADDALVEKYLDAGELTEEEVRRGLALGTLQRRFIPVVACAARPGVGIRDLYQAIHRLIPAADARGSILGEEGQKRQLTAGAPLAMVAFKNTIDPFVGRVTCFRIYSGKLAGDTPVLNMRTRSSERIGHVYKLDGPTQVEVKEAEAGDLVAVLKLKDVRVGDWIYLDGAPFDAKNFFPVPNRVIAYAVKTDRKVEEKVATSLHKLLEEDPALELTRDPDSGEMLLRGTGQVHLEVAIERLKRKFEVEVTLATPHPAYRETVKGKAEAEGKFVRQTGGRGQYAVCYVEVLARARGTGFEFVDDIVGGSIPRNFIPSVEKGVRDALKKGPLAGFPVVDFALRLFDGKFHTVDSSDMAFQIAGSMGFKQAFARADPVLLEPYYKMEIVVPEDFVGSIIGDLSSRRGKVAGMEPGPRGTVIRATAPHAEVMLYARELSSMTQGMGNFTMEFSHYEEVPPHLAQKIIAARQAETKGEAEA
jgi:elongation factor G